MGTVIERLRKIVIDHLGVESDEVVGPASFTDDLGADSLDVVELVMAMEDEFDVKIPDDAAEGIATVQQAVDYVTAQIGS
ncbi:acyl carrier protein [Pseudomonas sp. SWRI111]|uniref:acyl carrier protein n=1 Tax=Pseudomonas sp. SWRI111 TaxID=2745507 RepID=UPI001647D5EC|nr:acyl carrier protein [Pseudomonas sp. SWRI111]MBC3209622.1 acyl carrier protein [Pseudomonas sp. SWRI111]